MPTPPSERRDETNIGHGGPGLGQQLTVNSKRWWCAVALPVLCFGLFFSVKPVVAQDSSAVDDTTTRIEQLRDQAGAGGEVVGTQSPDAQAAVDQPGETVEEVEKILPPNESLPLGAGEGDLFSGQGTQADAGSVGDGWLLSTLAALGVVLVIIFGIRWVLKRGGVASPSVASGSVVEVLSRTTVAPRSHVVLMRVGQRILVVSDSSAGMRTLASVHDAEEVAELLGAVDASKSSSMTQNFGSVMKKLSGQWSSEEEVFEEPAAFEAEQNSPAVDQAEGALSRVRGRLAALSDTGAGRE